MSASRRVLKPIDSDMVLADVCNCVDCQAERAALHGFWRFIAAASGIDVGLGVGDAFLSQNAPSSNKIH